MLHAAFDFPRHPLAREDGERLRGAWWVPPKHWLRAVRPEEVRAVVTQAEAAARAGAWVLGGLRYEAASAFDPALATHDAAAPLAEFAVYDTPPGANRTTRMKSAATPKTYQLCHVRPRVCAATVRSTAPRNGPRSLPPPTGPGRSRPARRRPRPGRDTDRARRGRGRTAPTGSRAPCCQGAARSRPGSARRCRIPRGGCRGSACRSRSRTRADGR